MIGTGLVDLGVEVQIETVRIDETGLPHGPQLHRIEEHASVGGRADEYRKSQAMTGGQKSGGDSIGTLLLRIERAQSIAQFRPGHRVLEFGTRENGGQKAVLIE